MWRQRLMVHVFPVTDLDDFNDELRIRNSVDDAVIAFADAIRRTPAGEFS
jgi:hypothetical protein